MKTGGREIIIIALDDFSWVNANPDGNEERLITRITFSNAKRLVYPAGNKNDRKRAGCFQLHEPRPRNFAALLAGSCRIPLGLFYETAPWGIRTIIRSIKCVLLERNGNRDINLQRQVTRRLLSVPSIFLFSLSFRVLLMPFPVSTGTPLSRYQTFTSKFEDFFQVLVFWKIRDGTRSRNLRAPFPYKRIPFRFRLDKSKIFFFSRLSRVSRVLSS